MDWARHAIWWQVYPLGFAGAPIRGGTAPGHGLRRLIDWLDYAVELGVNGLLLGPIHASETHGYDTLDPFRVDPRLGGDEDFDALVAACKARGLRIVLDGVFSHVGAGHPDVARVLREGRDAPDADLFDIDWDAPGGPAPRVFEGHGSLVRLDHEGEAAARLATDVMRHWLDRGVDGWRLDAAYSVSPGFWARVLPAVRADHPDAWILGEVIHGDYAGFVGASGVDTVTQYELWKAIRSSLADRNLFELDWCLRRHNALLDAFVPHTFVGNHDVTRIASAVGQDGAVAALAILLTLGGVPAIYYGDEQGFAGVKEERLGGDDAVRPAFPAAPSDLAGWGRPVHHAHQRLIGLRRRYPWLVDATSAPLHLENQRCTYRVTARDGAAHLDVAVDLTGAPAVTIADASGEVLWDQRREVAAASLGA